MSEGLDVVPAVLVRTPFSVPNFRIADDTDAIRLQFLESNRPQRY